MVDDSGTDGGGHDEEQDEAEAIRDNLSTVYGQISDLATEIDDYLAESRHDQVKETVDSLAGLVTSADVEEAVDLGRLCAGEGRYEHGGDVGESVQIPHLALADLPAVVEPEIDDEYGHDEVVESLREREARCADHIRCLFSTAEVLLGQVTTAAEAGLVDQVESLLGRMKELPAELSSAYELWELRLVDLYNENPSNLGDTGNMIASMESWLVTRH